MTEASLSSSSALAARPLSAPFRRPVWRTDGSRPDCAPPDVCALHQGCFETANQAADVAQAAVFRASVVQTDVNADCSSMRPASAGTKKSPRSAHSQPACSSPQISRARRVLICLTADCRASDQPGLFLTILSGCSSANACLPSSLHSIAEFINSAERTPFHSVQPAVES